MKPSSHNLSLRCFFEALASIPLALTLMTWTPHAAWTPLVTPMIQRSRRLSWRSTKQMTEDRVIDLTNNVFHVHAVDIYILRNAVWLLCHVQVGCHGDQHVLCHVDVATEEIDREVNRVLMLCVFRSRGVYNDIEIRFRTNATHGLLYLASEDSLYSSEWEYCIIGVRHGFIELSLSLGSGDVTITWEHFAVNDGQWHTIRLTRC